MDKSVFSSKAYKDYLRVRTGAPGSKTGAKSALSHAMQCQPTHLSQVLHGNAHLSLEQAEKASEFYQHTKEETRFFLLMVQRDRAGTPSLRKILQEQMDEILTQRLILVQRLGKKQVLSAEAQAVYYSSWIYAAIHIALTVPELRTREALSRHLNVPIKRITEVLDYLLSIGLAVFEGNRFSPGATHIRLSNQSHNIIKHHTNWRNQAVDSLDREQLSDLHYSGVVSLSMDDVLRVKHLFLQVIDDSQKIVKESKEEELCAVNLDFFSLKKG